MFIGTLIQRINLLKVSKDKQRKLGSFKKGSHFIPSAFNIKQTYKLGRTQTCHISDMSQRKHGYMREKNTAQSTMA